MNLPVDTFVINLIRRGDRLDKFSKTFSFPFKVLEAFDGKDLSELIQLGRLTKSQLLMLDSLRAWKFNPVHQIPGLFGCWQSNLLLWCFLINSSDPLKRILVLEDDVDGIENINSLLPEVLDALPAQFDICYLGGQPTPSYRRFEIEHNSVVTTNSSRGTSITWNRMNNKFLNATSAYIISKKGAVRIYEILSEHLENKLPLRAIDDFIKESSQNMENFEIQPHIFSSAWNSPESDIR